MQYLIISRGTDASTATPLLATSDETVIAAALDALLERAGIPAEREGRAPTAFVTRETR